VVSGSAFDAINASHYNPDRFGSLEVIREPDPELRMRSRKILHDFFAAHGDPARAELLRD